MIREITQLKKLNTGNGSKRSTLMTVIAILGIMMLAPMAAVAENLNPGVFPPNSKPYGLTYGDWSAEWWKWALAIPASENPLVDTTGASCAKDQSGHVWFLAGTAGGQPITRACTVPAGKAILFPIINAAAWIPTDGQTEEEIRGVADFLMNHVTETEASVDGVPLQDLKKYRFKSELFTFTGSSEELFPGQSGTHDAVADGFWIMLAPLSAGQHEIHLRGVAEFPDGSTFETEVTYNLIVE